MVLQYNESGIMLPFPLGKRFPKPLPCSASTNKGTISRDLAWRTFHTEKFSRQYLTHGGENTVERGRGKEVCSHRMDGVPLS